MKKRFIFWDHDGVLVDTEKWYFEANRQVLSKLDIDLYLEEYLEIMQLGKSAWDIPREMGFSEEIIRKYREERNRLYQSYFETEDIEIPNVEKVLKQLSEAYSMAIVTTSKRDDFEFIHKDRSIRDYMDFVLTVEDYPHAKPAPDPYLAALDRFGASKEEAIVFEDSGRGLCSALAAGIDCVIIKNEFTKMHDFSGAKMVLDSIEEVPGIL